MREDASRDAVHEMLSAMAEAMAHRGPDDEGIEVVASSGGIPVGICARRLAIQDCSHLGHQPMVSPRTGTVLALNGELYNTDELRVDLEGLGMRFRGNSDTELALGAYDAWGVAAFPRFRGMFSIAVWDAALETVVLCRDRLGIKPLYYSASDGHLLFASEMRALLASGCVDRGVSVSAVASFLALGAIQEPESGLSDVAQLPAGHYGRWNGRSMTLTPYWSLEDAFTNRTPLSREEAIDELRLTLEDAVRSHLISDVPLGVFLSGGIDSSALVALVATVSGEPPRTVSVTFPQAEYSETSLMHMVRDRYETQHTEVHLGDDFVVEKVPAALAAMDHPSFDGVNTFIVSELARLEAGLTVSLSGLGSDELFGGYDTFSLVPQLNRIRGRVPRPAAKLASVLVDTPLTRNNRRDKMVRWLGQRDIDGPAYQLRRELFAPQLSAALLPGGPAARPPLPDFDTRDSINDVSYLELSVYMRNVLLRDSDVMGMANSLEIRVPFLDHRVVELVASMPGRWKAFDESAPKALLVDALKDLLPPEVVNRPKMGFVLPFGHWLRGPLKSDAEDVLLDHESAGSLGDLLDRTAVEKVWRGFLEGSMSWHRPWALYVLKRWAQRIVLPSNAATSH
jgi:asparagine synthase (glutamine-hydrolysing)